jgi:signal peptidase II
MDRRRVALVLSTVLFSALIDQVTKLWAMKTLAHGPGHSYLGDLARLQYAENPGAFLSLGASLPGWLRSGIFTWAVGIFLIGLLWHALSRTTLSTLHAVAMALVAAGGLSNWVDRVIRGGVVVDFMNLGIGSLRTGIFNFADLWIVFGVILLVFPDKRLRPVVKT